MTMMWETLYDYLDTQCTTIADLLPAIGKKAAPEHVHKLRTSIKRARACLTLIKQFSDKQFKGKRYARLLKILQQAAGALRDLQLQQESLRQYTKKAPQQYRFFKALLKDHARQAKEQAQATTQAFPQTFIKKLRKQPAQLPHISHKQLSNHLQEQYAAIAVPAGRVAAEKWHDLRKEVKRLHYQLEISQPLFEGSAALPLMLQFTDEAGSRLGSWHDLLALQQFIRNSMQLLRSEQIAAPRSIDGLLKQLAADTQQQLQYSREWIKQKPEAEL